MTIFPFFYEDRPLNYKKLKFSVKIKGSNRALNNLCLWVPLLNIIWCQLQGSEKEKYETKLAGAKILNKVYFIHYAHIFSHHGSREAQT